MENNQINVAIQLLPTKTTGDKIAIIDKAIELIKHSGLKHIVCPFETVVEGTYQQVFDLVNAIRVQSLKNNCEELIINIKIHASQHNLSFEDKLEKYK